MDVTDEELLSYISESSMMSKSMEEYDGTPRLGAGKLFWLSSRINQDNDFNQISPGYHLNVDVPEF